MSVKVLFVVNIAPCPPYGGQYIRCYNLIDSLSQHFEVGVVAPAVPADCALLQQVRWFPFPDEKMRVGFKGLFRPKPSWQHCIENAHQQFRPDVTWFDFTYWGAYRPIADRFNSKTILGMHNIQPDITKQRIQATRSLKGWGRYWAERWHEQRTFPHFDRIISVSENDQKYHDRFVGRERSKVIPNYINESWYQNSADTDRAADTTRAADTIVVTANFASFQNEQGTHWLIDQVWPLVRQTLPHAQLQLVGNGAKNFTQNKDNGIECVGRVPTIAPYLRTGTVAAVPILHGSGSRFKILEALACEIPIVSTALGADGLTLTSGQNIVIADATDAFASALVSLISNREKADNLAQKGYLQLQQAYGFAVNTARIRSLVEDLVGMG